MQLTKLFVYSISVILMAILGILTLLNHNVWSHGDGTGKGYQEPVKIGPNEGMLVELDENYIEIVVDYESGEIALIMLDKDMKPISVPEDTTGLGYLRIQGNPVKWFDFKPGYRDQATYLYATTGIENIGPFNAVIRLNIAEETKNYRFSWSPLVHKHSE